MNAKQLLFTRPFLFAILTQFVAFSTLTHTAATQNSATGDCLALLAIKSMIKDGPKGVMTSWNHSTTTNFCRWQGVTCSARHQRVTFLDLSSGGLIGTVSPSIGNLSFLWGIDLSNNSFSGEIPPEIGRLFRLRELCLSNNSFTGNIPAALSNCSNLQVLRLGYNNLVGKIPDGIGSLSMLSILVLQFNNLEGGIPPFIANLTLLEILFIGDCQLGGSIPNLFHQLTNLRRLAMNGNNFNGTIPPSLYNCSSLEDVYLHDNQLTGRLHKRLGSIMPRLVALSLSQNNIQGNLSSIPATLQLLDLRSNKFWGKLPFLTNGLSLIYLDLSSNSFVGSLHNLVCSNGANKTRFLILGNNQLSGVIPECWKKWSSLLLLCLQNNNLSGEIPRTLGYVRTLQSLNIYGNKISGILPSSLTNLSYLKILLLGRNNLLGIIPPWIGTKLTLLKILNLRSNNFYGDLPHQLCYLSNVRILDLAHNNLSGNIPGCFNNFSVLSGKETNSQVQFSFGYYTILFTFGESLVIKGQENFYREFLGLVFLLDLSSNNLSGQIPGELMTLHELRSLNLSRNQLSGKIPDKIGDMKLLESFDLSVNNLSGELPISLSRLSFLSCFNVSYNNLIGRIPLSTQIQSLDESSFFGNNLCGAPLTNDCAPVESLDFRDLRKDDGSHGADWGLIISTVLGFIVGFWIFMASLIISKSWRIAYFRLMSKIVRVYDLGCYT